MRIVFVGGGNMANALVGGLSSRGVLASDVAVIDPAAAQREVLAARFPGIEVSPAASECRGMVAAEVMVLAVKPQQMRDALRPVVPFLGASSAVVLSIAAGLRLADISRWLGGYG